MRLSNALAPIVVLLAVSPALAGIRPSFDEESCAKNATEIVVATEGNKVDGELEVLETWKGSLAKGTKIVVPDLASFEEAGTRAIWRGWREDKDQPTKHVTGQRMVLFLKGAPGAWRSANSWGREMKVSVVWVETDAVYGFVQVMNPGDSVLVPVAKTEKELHDQVDKVIGAWADIAKARALADPGARARALAPLTRAESWDQSAAAFEGLAGCGKDAVPHLREILADASVSGRHSAAIQAFARAAGDDAGPELTRMVETELAFWKETGPKLAKGWWTNSKEIMPTENRYGMILEVFRSLRTLRPAACRPVVTEFRDFWRSLPQLEDSSGLNQMSSACDDVLRALDAPGTAPDPRRVETPKDEPAPASEADAPLTTDEDSKRVAELEETLARELALERSRPREARRKVVGREPSNGDAHATLVELLARATKIPYEDWRSYSDELVASWTCDHSPLPLSKTAEATRTRLADNVKTAEATLAADRLVRPFEIEEKWPALLARGGFAEPGDVDGLRAAFILESLHALESKQAGQATRLAIDLWQLEHEIRRDPRLIGARARPDWGGEVGQLLAAALPECEAKTLTSVDEALTALEVGLPSLASEVRMRRLAVGCYFRAYRKGELKGVRADQLMGERGADATPLDHLSPRARLSDRREGSIRREWEKLDALFREFEKALERFERPKGQDVEAPAHPTPPWERLPGSSFDSWRVFLSDQADRFLGDVARLRLLRVIVGAQRFRAEKGRWPADAKEAVGAELAEKLVDPFTGEPFKLAVDAAGVLRARLATRAGRSEASRAFAFRSKTTTR